MSKHKRGPKEVIFKVKSKISGEEFYASNLHKRIVDGHTYIGISRSPTVDAAHLNWIRKDHIIEVRNG